MSDWRTTTKRFTPQYKSRPKKWRMEQLDVLTQVCPECSHPVSHHFYEEAYPEFSFCGVMQPVNCDCTCSQFDEE